VHAAQAQWAQAAAAHKLQRTAASQWQSSSSARAFRAWSDTVLASQRARELMAGGVSALQNSLLGFGLRRWLESKSEGRLLRAGAQLQLRTPAATMFALWKAGTRKSLDILGLVSSATVRWELGSVLHAWSTWTDRRPLRAVLTAGDRTVRVALARALLAWSGRAARSARNSALRQQLVELREGASAERALRTWRGARRVLPRPPARAPAWRDLLNRWRVHAAYRKLRAQQLDSSAEHASLAAQLHAIDSWIVTVVQLRLEMSGRTRGARVLLLGALQVWIETTSLASVRGEMRMLVEVHRRSRAMEAVWRRLCAHIVEQLRMFVPERTARAQVRRAFRALKLRLEVMTRGARRDLTGTPYDHALARWRMFATLRVCIATRATLVNDYRLLRLLTHALFGWRRYSVLRALLDDVESTVPP
jgi:hypothetical protein